MQQHDENTMTKSPQGHHPQQDPLGLSQLGPVEPEFDGWKQVADKLQTHNVNRRHWRRAGGGLAIAASLILVIALSMFRQNSTTEFQNHATLTADTPSDATEAPIKQFAIDQSNINALIGLSQNMEQQVKHMRSDNTVLPAKSAIYVAELEDLIAQVDTELSLTPGSVDLWGQRVNLLLDLAQIYQQQWQIDYGRIASL